MLVTSNDTTNLDQIDQDEEINSPSESLIDPEIARPALPRTRSGRTVTLPVRFRTGAYEL